MGVITEVADRYVDQMAEADPVASLRSMGVVGEPEWMTDYSPDGVARLRDLLASTADALAPATPEDEAERLGKAYLGDLVADRLAVIDSGEPFRMVSAVFGPQSTLRMMFDLLDRTTPAGWELVAARLERTPGALAGYRAALAHGLDSGGPPAGRRTVDAVAEQCRTWAGGGWFQDYAGSYGDGPLRSRLEVAADAAAEAYADLGSWLAGEYALRAAAHDSVGEERYRVWARSMLGTQLDLDDAYAWGWEELGRLEREKAEECNRIVPGGSFDDVRRLLMTDPGRQIEGVDAYREWLQRLTDETIDAINGVQFDIPPPLDRCVVGIPAEGSAGAPYYTPPSEDLSTPGHTWFPTMGRTSFPTWDQATTVYHEAVPGHHLQFAATRVVPLVRAHRLGFSIGHGEGWALYAERLMDELDRFETPDARLGFLSMQAFRAARVVIDIGVHTGRTIPDGWPGAGGRWTHELAVAMLEQAAGLATDYAESEVLRYYSLPAQATGYKLGEKVWLEGREAARARAGDGFDLKSWHANALALGPLGLDRLAAELPAC
jgi:uncharacterized protein (DUF885 family)